MSFVAVPGSGSGGSQCNLLRFAGYSQPGGSGCSASTNFTDYDELGNARFFDDFNGNRVCYGYTTVSDGLANQEKVRVEGLTGKTGVNASATPTDCATVTASGASLPAGSRKISTKWHPHWALKVEQAEPLLKTTWVYHGQPDPFNGGAVASCITPMYGASTVPTLPDGNPIAVVCKKVEQATTDANGSQGLNPTLDTGGDIGAVAQRQWTYEYNQYGQILSSTDPLALRTTYEYYTETSFTGVDPVAQGYTKGDLKRVINSALHVTNYTLYDKSGRLLSMTDPNGLVTTFSYWPRGWLKSVNQGGMLTQYDYWPTGLLKKATQPDGTYLYYVYDDAHRLTDITDQVDANGSIVGNKVHYTLDNAGNRTAEEVSDTSGALSRKITRDYDALNRLWKVTGAAQ